MFRLLTTTVLLGGVAFSGAAMATPFLAAGVEVARDAAMPIADRQGRATRVNQIPRSIQAAIAPKINALAVANGGSPTAQLDDAEANLACGGDYLMVTWDEDKSGKPVPGTTVLHCLNGKEIEVD